jgi:hypothetical protein
MLHVQLGALYCQRETVFPSVTVMNLAVTLAFGKSSPLAVRPFRAVCCYTKNKFGLNLLASCLLQGCV